MIIKEPRKAEREFWHENYEEYVSLILTKAKGPTEDFKLKVFSAVYNNFDHSSNKCTKKCNDNPNCLENLKVEDWETEDEDVETVAVGIKNLGATCYLNTLLQIWFYNPAFRRGIYEYPHSVDNPDLLCQLQMIFAELELSKKKFIDVKPLVEMLQLQPAVQQDALEFSKLLTSLLEELVGRKSTIDGNCRKALHQYKGEHIFVITCTACQNRVTRSQSFYELEISLTEQSSLNNEIKNSLSTELLDGDNKYLCSQCQTKQTATRSVRIGVLPDTINFQVNRFIFDMQSLTKKKSNAHISFPIEIDMAEHVEGFRTGRQSWYDLRAVLLHRGSSANSGHYIARVYDHKSKTWLDCDDECVTTLDPLDFQIDSPDEDDFSKKRKKRVPSPKPQSGVYQSNSCYLLVYQKRVEHDVVYPKAPSSLIPKIEMENELITSKAGQEKLTLEEKKLYRNTMIESFKELYSIWNVDVLNPNAIYLANDQFVTALDLVTTKYLDNPPSDDTEKAVIDNKALLCSHENLDPEKQAAEKLQAMNFEIANKLCYSDACQICFDQLVANHVETALHNQDIAMIGEKSSGKRYFISKSWFSEWRKKVPFDGNVPRPDDERFKKEVYCPHRARTIDSTMMVEISSPIYKILQTRFPGFITLSTAAPICDICIVAENEHELSGEQMEATASEWSSLKRLQSRKRCTIFEGSTYYIIPEIFIEEWRAYIKRSSNKILPPTKIDTNLIVCSEHQKLVCNIPNSIEKINFAELPNGIVVSQEEFDLLRSSYPLEGPEVRVTLVSYQTFEYSPDFCLPCQHALRLDFKKAKITIVKKEPLNTPTPITKRRKTLTSKSASKHNIVVEPTTTVHQLKLELMEKFQAPPFYQKLFFKGQECMNEATMFALGVYAGVELLLEVFEENGHEFQDEATFEGGFQGTMLSGWRPTGSGWSCGSCTLINDERRTVCEACETPKS